MFNCLLMLGATVICFTLLLFTYKFFKKDGLYAWIAVVGILANIMVCKQVDVLGHCVSLGSVLFGSSFLATDILTIKYGKKDATKGVIIGLVAVIGFIIATQLGLLFIPSESDVGNTAMTNLFALSARVSIASVTMYFISNLVDVYIFDKLRNKFKGKLWLSNNIATIISNVGENYLFGLLAFAGIFSVPMIFQMCIVGSIIEVVIALIDTPFLYLARKIKE